MKPSILSPAVEAFIQAHEFADVSTLLLKYNRIDDEPISVIIDQIIGRRKAKDKIPLYYRTSGIEYPPAKNLEQSSSETTAKFKAELAEQLVIPRSSCVDLTGGFGVDSFFLSQVFDKSEMIEPDATLLELSKRNHELLGASNIHYYCTDAKSFLEHVCQESDLFFIDPSRRIKGDRKVSSLSESEPNLLSLLPLILAKGKFLLIKAAPLLDIRQGLSEIPQAFKVFIVAVDNDCKELLFIARPEFSGDPDITAVNITAHGREHFNLTLDEERAALPSFTEPLTYLYEPNSAILKAGAFKLVATRFKVSKLHINTHLYTSDDLITNFPGRIFRVIGYVKPERKSVLAAIPEGKANIAVRNYPMNPAELKKIIKFNDGGEKFLIGFTGINKKYLIAAERVH